MDGDFDFNEIGKLMPYLTPDGFFECMQAETLRRAEEACATGNSTGVSRK